MVGTAGAGAGAVMDIFGFSGLALAVAAGEAPGRNELRKLVAAACRGKQKPKRKDIIHRPEKKKRSKPLHKINPLTALRKNQDHYKRYKIKTRCDSMPQRKQVMTRRRKTPTHRWQSILLC